jgi:hypothetical protein
MTTFLPTTRLGRTGMHVTRAGFGAWAIGGGGWACAWGNQPQGQRADPIFERDRTATCREVFRQVPHRTSSWVPVAPGIPVLSLRRLAQVLS